MSIDMSAEACGSGEALVTTLVTTLVVTDFLVLTFDVVLQVAVAEEGFGTGEVGALEGTFVGVRANVLFETSLTVECLVAVFPGTLQILGPRQP